MSFGHGVNPLPIAHRGSQQLWPENTMVAFQGAVDLGFRFLETDLHASQDGVVVCFHDDRLERTTDAGGALRDRTFDQLREVDAGYRFGRRLDFPWRGKGVEVPSLEELATTFPAAQLVLDLKEDGLTGPLLDLIGRLKLWDRLIVGSFSDGRLADFRLAAAGRVATSTSPPEVRLVWRASRRGGAVALEAEALQIPRFYRGVPVVTRRFVETAHRSGVAVHVWTVNQPGEMRRLLDLGVDGLITDRPDLLRPLLEARGTWHG